MVNGCFLTKWQRTGGKASACRGNRGDLGGWDSRAGGSGAGLRARIAGLVEGKVPRKPIGAAARVRAGQMRMNIFSRGMCCCLNSVR